MRAVIQRVKEAKVNINETVKGSIQQGLLVLLGIEGEDTIADAEWLSTKITQLRIFKDENRQMNLGIKEINGNILIISQFTLYGNIQKGKRPSFIRAARPEFAEPMYEKFVALTEEKMGQPVQTGTFGADMKVHLINDGPVTLLIDTKNKDL
jgi:D-tyrosyl-tRNA(Tyr) deacylase